MKPLFLLCRRQRRGGTADYDSDSDASKQSRQLVRVRVNEQKIPTKRTEVNITPRDRRTALNLAQFLPGGGTNDPAFQPFAKGVSWERMRTLLGRLVRPEDPGLWAEANAIGSGLGSHEFRRLAMNDIDSADPTKKDALVRGLGADRVMVDKVYRDARKVSYERTQAVRENMYGAAAAAPARAPARAAAAATATSTRAQPAVNNGVMASRSQEEAIAQAALDLDCAREDGGEGAREQARK